MSPPQHDNALNDMFAKQVCVLYLSLSLGPCFFLRSRSRRCPSPVRFPSRRLPSCLNSMVAQNRQIRLTLAMGTPIPQRWPQLEEQSIRLRLQRAAGGLNTWWASRFAHAVGKGETLFEKSYYKYNW